MRESFLGNLRVKSNYHQILLNSVIASCLVYEENPIKVINESRSGYSHTIKKLVKSQKDVIDVNYMVCDCSTDNNNVLLLSFGVTKSMQDFFINFQLWEVEIEGVEAYFHFGLYQRAMQIPINFFIDKILNENYEIVLTGHSLGASVAALVTIRILASPKILSNRIKRNKVLCIGFGSPAFSDSNFKKFIEKDCKDNFHFYFNENDYVVELLNCFLNYLISNEKSEANDPFLKTALELLISFSLGFSKLSFDKFKGILEASMNIKSEICEYNEKYQYFGTILNFNEKEIVSRKKIKKLTKDAMLDFKPDKYLKNLNLILKKKNKNLSEKEVNRFDELDVPCFNFKDDGNHENYFSIRLIQNAFDFDCFLTLNCKNIEYIVNSITNSHKICSIDCITENTKNEKTFLYKFDNKLIRKNFTDYILSIDSSNKVSFDYFSKTFS